MNHVLRLLNWHRRLGPLLLSFVFFAPQVRAQVDSTGRLEIVFFNLNLHGLATFIKTPLGRTFLYDAGNKQTQKGVTIDHGRDIIGPFLHQRGIRRMDALLISHSHPDHYGGAFYLVDPANGFQVSELVDVGFHRFSEFENRVIKKITASPPLGQGGRVRVVKHADTLDWDPALEVRVYSPPTGYLHRPGKPDSDNEVINENSMVVAIRHGEFRLLLPGDINRVAMDWLMKHVPAAELKATVLQTPHHGVAMPGNLLPFVEYIGKPQIVFNACIAGNDVQEGRPGKWLGAWEHLSKVTNDQGQPYYVWGENFFVMGEKRPTDGAGWPRLAPHAPLRIVSDGADYVVEVGYDPVAGALPPSVALSSPKNQQRLVLPQGTPTTTVTLRAEAAGAEPIQKVEFYHGARKLGETLAAPYMFTWNQVPPGDYTLTAKAWDSKGRRATSWPVHIRVVPEEGFKSQHRDHQGQTKSRIGSGAGDCAPAPSHTTGRAVFRIQRLNAAALGHGSGKVRGNPQAILP